MATARAMLVDAYPVTAGKVFPSDFILTGGTIDVIVRGLGVKATLDTDAIWRTVWKAPAEIPVGTTPKLELELFSPASSGVIKANPGWVAKSPNADLSATARSSEGLTPTVKTGGGATDTMEWATGDNIQGLRVKWTLDATTAPTAGQLILLDIALATSGWTLAQVLTMVPDVFWE